MNITKKDVHSGFLFHIAGMMERVFKFDIDTINGIDIDKCSPIIIEDWIIETHLKMQFYNGWFYKDIVVYRENDRWVANIGDTDIVVKYIHNIQSLVYSIYGDIL